MELPVIYEDIEPTIKLKAFIFISNEKEIIKEEERE